MRWERKAGVSALCLALVVLTGCEEDGSEASRRAPDTVPTAPAPPAADAEGFQQVIYVSPEGDDEDVGLSPETALGSVQVALEVAQPGDAVFVLPGVYQEGIDLYGAGSQEAPITVRGLGEGAVLDGEGERSLGLWCEVCTNFVVENLEFRNYSDIGIGFSQSASIRLSNLRAHGNGFAPQLVDWEIEGYGLHVEDSWGVVIENSEFYENGPNPQTLQNMMGTGIDVYNCTGCEILHNRSHHNTGGGILVEDSVDVLVEGNEVFENDLDASIDEWWDGGIWVDGGHDIIVRDNVFRDNLGPGIEVSNEDNQHPYGYVLEGNVSTGNYFGIYIWNFTEEGMPDEGVLRMVDNEIAGNTRQDVWVEGMVCPPDDPCE